ncbi:MAG: ABC transporter ATP-binding protein [Balneola sp.]|nr:ABC transporter ATP-binding protein [Balneola sp.]MBO6650986.1 ABC transporter ATP-binding protein [Balneola sp.]MBO6711147.1 ABC transporter ATP-binding protein [Balneola sp.]MBO6800739.1 ABC transporter ATP-binding protein [Balneola sp.]MBO6869082.1 ABC transporter ATP-binding protein [Balneola sp.]
MNHILKLNKLTRQFKSGDKTLTVVDNVTFEIEEGISCAIVGPSGSGKTTLLGLSAGLDQSTSGDVTLNGINLNPLTEDQRAEVRNRHVGFVFQTFQLVPTLTAVENVMVPLELRGEATNKVRERAIELLTEVGLGERSHHYPTQLSGGEQQRVAVARAFINNPKILFADEPTGNLDSETGEHIENLIFDLNRKQGTTLVLVTHDLDLADKCDRVIKLKNGEVDSDVFKSSEEAVA